MSGNYTEEKKYIIESEVPCYDVDSNMDLKPAAFMDMAQEIAYQAATALGFGSVSYTHLTLPTIGG